MSGYQETSSFCRWALPHSCHPHSVISPDRKQERRGRSDVIIQPGKGFLFKLRGQHLHGQQGQDTSPDGEPRAEAWGGRPSGRFLSSTWFTGAWQLLPLPCQWERWCLASGPFVPTGFQMTSDSCDLRRCCSMKYRRSQLLIWLFCQTLRKHLHFTLAQKANDALFSCFWIVPLYEFTWVSITPSENWQQNQITHAQRPTILGYNLRAMSDHISALPERSELIFISKVFLGEPSFPTLATFFKILFYLFFYTAGSY